MSTESHSPRDSQIPPSIPGSAGGSRPNHADLNPYRAQPNPTAPIAGGGGSRRADDGRVLAAGRDEPTRPTRIGCVRRASRRLPPQLPRPRPQRVRAIRTGHEIPQHRGEPGRRLRSRRLGRPIPLERRHPGERAANGHGRRHRGVRRPGSRFLEPDREARLREADAGDSDRSTLPPTLAASRGRQRAAQAIVTDDLAARHPASATIADPGQREDKPQPIPHFAPLPH